ncbi:MAG: RNA-binding S4 domain-containing protein [Bacteroidales bacterium]|nr:RNA-binding S4 domain-containing protein [Bacteroidales bacterium]
MERIDKYLWAIRAFKTRSEAAAACGGNRVRINGATVKSSRQVRIGDTITVRKGPVEYTYVVLKDLSTRVGAALVEEYVRNETPQSELSKLKAPVETVFLYREKGAGRPTKKDRRAMDMLLDSIEDEINL